MSNFQFSIRFSPAYWEWGVLKGWGSLSILYQILTIMGDARRPQGPSDFQFSIRFSLAHGARPPDQHRDLSILYQILTLSDRELLQRWIESFNSLSDSHHPKRPPKLLLKHPTFNSLSDSHILNPGTY